MSGPSRGDVPGFLADRCNSGASLCKCCSPRSRFLRLGIDFRPHFRCVVHCEVYKLVLWRFRFSQGLRAGKVGRHFLRSWFGSRGRFRLRLFLLLFTANRDPFHFTRPQKIIPGSASKESGCLHPTGFFQRVGFYILKIFVIMRFGFAPK